MPDGKRLEGIPLAPTPTKTDALTLSNSYFKRPLPTQT